MNREFYVISVVAFGVVVAIAFFWPPVLLSLLLLVPLFLLGVWDGQQSDRAVLRNFPVIGHFRYLLESIRPEINQYFIESNVDGTPYSRDFRSVVYQRAKGVLDTVPFGTERDVYELGYEFMNHSIGARRPPEEAPRISIGGPECSRPYRASLLNISAMSFGSMSSNAILALNGGAKDGGFYHNTGEGSISPYHLEPGGDLVWQIGTGYFGCRTADGAFSPEAFAERAALDAVKMIEIKLSQGAKPGHGGILPAIKITPEIAAIRGVPLGQDILSPPAHSTFSTPRELVRFVQRLRELADGKPVGIKLCLGNPHEFMALCKGAVAEGLTPDFVSVDGGEGGTGAAPLEFSNSVGWPLTEGLVLVHNTLQGFGLREDVRVIASGKIVTGFHMAKRLAAGADLCNSARAFMFALGCIQARRCNANVCPVGVATQDPGLVRGLVVEGKRARVANFHRESVEALMELLGAAGLDHPDDLRPGHVLRRVSNAEVKSYGQIYEYIPSGSLLQDPVPASFEAPWLIASPDDF